MLGDYSLKQQGIIDTFRSEFGDLSPEEIGMILSLDDESIRDFLLTEQI